MSIIDWYIARWMTPGERTHDNKREGENALIDLSSLLSTRD